MADKKKQKLSPKLRNSDKGKKGNPPESEAFDEDASQAIEKLADSLPEDASSNPAIARSLAIIKRSVSFSGPIPSPNAMEKYEEVLPGIADRIMTMAEKEQKLREKSITGVIWVEKVKVSGSVFVSALLIGAGVYCAILGQPFLGGVFGTAGLVAAIFRRFLHPKESD